MVAAISTLVLVEIIVCTNQISALQKEYKPTAGDDSLPRQGKHLKIPHGPKFEAKPIDGSIQDKMGAGEAELLLQRLPRLTLDEWLIYEASSGDATIPKLEFTVGHSSLADGTLSHNITSNTVAGATREVFFGTAMMRRNLMLAVFLIIAVVFFESVHTWSSGIDFTANPLGMEDMEQERATGIGPFRGAMRLWGDYIAEDTTYAIVCMAILATLIVLNGFIEFLLVEWLRHFWDDAASWVESGSAASIPQLHARLLEFCFFALLVVITDAYAHYVGNMLKLRARTYMTHKYTNRWLSNFAHYHLLLPGLSHIGATNADQRIQEDINLFTSDSLILLRETFASVIKVCLLSPLVYSMSPPYFLGIEGLRCTGWLLLTCWVYAIFAICLTHLVGRRMEPIQYYQQRLEADFRWELGCARNHSEQIALARGEDLQEERAHMRFERIRRCVWEGMFVQKRIQFARGFLEELLNKGALVFLGPSFLKGQVTLGTVMAAARCTKLLGDALMVFSRNYNMIAEWRASTARLLRFEESMDRHAKYYNDYVLKTKDKASTQYLSCQDLTIWKPGDAASHESVPEIGGAMLLRKLDFSVLIGQRVLLSGPSGTGKTSFLRSLVGAWPFVEGQVMTRDGVNTSLCFPSDTYLPSGELRSVVTYPVHSHKFLDADIEAALRTVGLDHLLSRGLDYEEDWSKVLSDGQKARITFARLVLQKPTFAAMDEPLMHLDEAGQAQILSAVKAALGDDTSLLVVHHAPNPETRAFFNVHYRLDAESKVIVEVD